MIAGTAPVESSFRSCQRFPRRTSLAAWATAYVKLHGPNAVDEIEATRLRDARRTEAEIRAVLTALSAHGRAGHVYLCDHVTKSYGIALQVHPRVAGPIAADLTQWIDETTTRAIKSRLMRGSWCGSVSRHAWRDLETPDAGCGGFAVGMFGEREPDGPLRAGTQDRAKSVSLATASRRDVPGLHENASQVACAVDVGRCA